MFLLTLALMLLVFKAIQTVAGSFDGKGPTANHNKDDISEVEIDP